MGQANKSTTVERTRLEPIIDRRFVGVTINTETGLPEAQYRGYIIGHGQQLAARRLAKRFATPTPSPLIVTSRQVERAAARVAAKAKRQDSRLKKAPRADGRTPVGKTIQTWTRRHVAFALRYGFLA